MSPENLFPARSEWLEADGLGGFASGTVDGVRTRRYHALLLTAVTPPEGRMVLVNGFDAEIETSAGSRIPLTRQLYAPGVEAPAGPAPATDFSAEPWPTWRWTLDPATIIQGEIFVPKNRSAVVVTWRCVAGATTGLRLRVRPFFSGRDFHALQHENPSFHFSAQAVPGGQRWMPYSAVPAVTGIHNGTFQPGPVWYRNFLYEEERARGFDFLEDLAVPGVYEFDLSQHPAVLVYIAGSDPLRPDENPLAVEALAAQWAGEERTRRAAFPDFHQRAADTYLVQRGPGKTVIAGYPWFGDWGRDTFISMRGLCLATGRWPEARDILVAWAASISEGMLPNRFPEAGSEPEYNSVDASLWYVVMVHEFLEATASCARFASDRPTLLTAIEEILRGYTAGTRFAIHADTDGLLACGVPGMQLTWMDAKVGDQVVTPRIGKPVEVQALWLNALGLTARTQPEWQAPFEKGAASFEQRFWNEARGCLYDVVDADHQPGKMDDRLRPNQLFALGGLPLAFFPGAKTQRALQLVEDQLWTPLGLRSLAPGEKDYAPHYVGGPDQRDRSYHQGTAWPWLAGPFLEARVRLQGSTPEAKAEARALLEASQLTRPDLPGLLHVPEIADAEAPFTPRGCPFQAWSVGELLRLQLQVLRP